MTRLLTTLLIGRLLLPAQTTFDVVSIKRRPVETGRVFVWSTGPHLMVRGNTFDATVTTLKRLVIDAYNVRDHEILGLPAWAETDYYTVNARSENTPTLPQLREMLQAMLADRFQMKLHRETKELSVYLLTVDPKGHKMRKLGDDEKVPTYATPPPDKAPVIGSFAGLVDLLSRFVDRPLLDRTGLSGNYESARLDYARFGREKRGEPADGPSIFASVQQLLGLHMEPGKESTPVLVVDSVERPSAN